MHPLLALAAALSIPLTVAYILNANNKVFMDGTNPPADMDTVMVMRQIASAAAADYATGGRCRNHPDGVAVIVGLYPSIMLNMIKAMWNCFCEVGDDAISLSRDL